MNKGRFTIRVYGIAVNEKKQVLIVDEIWFDTKMTKFPGGGLEFGEGTIDCLKREFMEETNLSISNINHFYTTDFFQEARFFRQTQLISIYYTCSIDHENELKTSKTSFDFEEDKNGAQSFRWVNIENLDTNMSTFPIDQLISEKIKTHFCN